MKYPYHNSYFPPLPSLEVVLQSPEGNRTEPLTVLVDTGADTTIVPTTYLVRLGTNPFEDGFLRSQWGERRPVGIYLLDVHVANLYLPGIEVVGDEQGREVILGRNVLNTLILLLDGPSQTTDVLAKRPRIVK